MKISVHPEIKGCQGCEERTLGCHSDCEKYATYKKKLEKARRKEKYDKIRCEGGWSYQRK